MVGVVARLACKVGTFALDLAFEAPAGRVTALTGPSGAGKTSVLRWIAGLEPIAGSLTVEGDAWDRLPAYRRRIGMVFQGQGLLPHLTVAGNLAYAAKRAADPMATEEIAGVVGATHLLDRKPATLSGGEAQRAALARALIGRPKLLLLDEPLSALDVEARGEMVALLEGLLPTLGLTTILVSHDVGEVARLADHVVAMRAGRIV